MNTPFVLYCKSYKTDIKRVIRLADSIKYFNKDKIPLFISAPQADIPLFKKFLDTNTTEVIADEDIIKSNKSINRKIFDNLPGNITQQIVKSEFWRLGFSRSYLCLDSDAIFLREFDRSDFLSPKNTPYTIIDEGRELLLASLAKKKLKVLDDFRRESDDIQKALGRAGKVYNFGPNCPVWDARVWESLDQEYTKQKNLSFMDLIIKHPYEMRWYGEALLRYRAIELLPSQPFFKMYHYAWQQKQDIRNGVDSSVLSRIYCGVVFQSAWEREMDWPSEGGNWLSRTARHLRRGLGRM
jgi:hypothetical protein